MSEKEVNELLDRIQIHYNYFNANVDTLREWHKVLSKYDSKEVNKAFDEFLVSDKSKNDSPKLIQLIANLESIKIVEKNLVYKTTCQICGKPLLSTEYQNHFGRCLSIDFVIKETKKWFDKDLTRAELWNMEASEFEERYNKLLKYIQEHTNDESERQRIECIFNPPERKNVNEKFLKEME